MPPLIAPACIKPLAAARPPGRSFGDVRSEAGGAFEARLLGAVLAHVDRRLREFDRRPALLEAGQVKEENPKAAARALHLEIRRVAAATALLQLHLQLRRAQLSELRPAPPNSRFDNMETH